MDRMKGWMPQTARSLRESKALCKGLRGVAAEMGFAEDRGFPTDEDLESAFRVARFDLTHEVNRRAFAESLSTARAIHRLPVLYTVKVG
jgi:hypothetical protein